MSNYEILEKEAISNSQVKEILDKRVEEQEERELRYREEKTIEYLKNQKTFSVEEFNSIKEEIVALDIPRLDEEHIVKIIDLMPTNGTQLRAITSHSGIILVDENATAILDVLKSHN